MERDHVRNNRMEGGPEGMNYYTQKNHFEILLNQPEIKLYYHFPIDLNPNGRPIGSKSTGK